MSRFDEKAKEWNSPRNRERAEYVAGIIRSAMPLSTESTAFEYGAGTGLLSFELCNDVGSVIHAVNSDKMLKVLNERIANHSVENMRPVRLNLSEDPPLSNRFNLIYTMIPLHHTSGVRQLFRKFHELLEDGGLFCLADLELDKYDSFPGYDADLVHKAFDQNDLASITKKAGFKDISFIPGSKWNMRLIKAQRNSSLYF
ncbi:MAG TPA: class I SAM-dependent methyltransferase [Fodinibius sp.]|nr:class I SAM-dependent methyltransferase [Fodinibius sp.]